MAEHEFDYDKFRLRRFVDRLVALGEVEVHEEPVALAEVAAHLNGNPKAVLFRKAGPEGAELIGGVLGSRARVAAAFGVEERALLGETLKRIGALHPAAEVPSSDAPVHQVVLTGKDADFTALPVHLLHEHDGGPYISAGIDFTVNPETGFTNIGFRRLMLRGRREAGTNLYAPTDLREAYRRQAARGQSVPCSFVVGSHPVDSIAAMQRVAGDDLALLGAFRGEPVPVVRCVTNELRVPADAEMVLEGFLDERGYSELEGPFGEFMGYYGEMKPNPVFHLTAITRRRDALFQTMTISGRRIGLSEAAVIGAIECEANAWKTLLTAVREPLAVHATLASNGNHNVRVAMRQRVPGEARNAIAALLGSHSNIKHVFVVDEDLDVFSDEDMEWALSTRFQADRDLVVQSGYRAIRLDPSLEGKRVTAKAGFDLTVPFGKLGSREFTVGDPPRIVPERKYASVREALQAGPASFAELMRRLGSEDGREIVLALEELRGEGRLERLEHGEYALKKD